MGFFQFADIKNDMYFNENCYQIDTTSQTCFPPDLLKWNEQKYEKSDLLPKIVLKTEPNDKGQCE